MYAPARITSAARTRVRECADEIGRSLLAIAEGRPGDAEIDEARRTNVVQARKRVSLDEARQLARESGPEAMWGNTIDFVDVSFFERGLLAARSVCRIATQNGDAVGTGFLISSRLLITNNHVVSSAAAARGMVAEFDFERDLAGVPRSVTRFGLAPEVFFVTDDQDNLDFTVIALAQRIAGLKDIAEYGYLPLSAARNKHALGDIVNIIQHPDGRMKEAVVRENQLVSRPKSGTVLHYVADTEPGSSGAPVFNVMWDVVALHHWGGPHRELFDEKGLRVPRTVNEGVRISAIVLDLQTRKAGLEPQKMKLIDEALGLGMASPPARLPLGLPRGEQQPDNVSEETAMTVAADGTVTWYIPLAVSVRPGALPPALRADRNEPAAPQTSGAAVVSNISTEANEAKVRPDPNYAERTGYDPGFLESAVIPLPKLSAAQKRVAARNKVPRDGDNPYELRYEHFSVVMNAKRRLAFFTATNIDGAAAKDVDRNTLAITDAAGPADDEEEAAEAAERWYEDPRIDEGQQTPPDLFAKQTAFDSAGRLVKTTTSDHRNRMFQQGHLTRRQDPLWGSDDAVLRANADTFHVTNRAPQVGYFNMGVRKPAAEAKKHPGGTLYWRALEDYILTNARADRKRVIVFTGPILDDENDIAWSRGRSVLRGFKAPREFWKLVIRVENGMLQATALIADQSPLIDFVPELLDVDDEEAHRISFDKVAKYHVSVAELQDRTGLKFGADVLAADTYQIGTGDEARRRAVNHVDDVSLERPKSGQARLVGARKSRRAGRSTRARRRRSV